MKTIIHFFIFLFAIVNSLYGQSTISRYQEKKSVPQAPVVYLTGGINIELGIAGSKDMNKLLDPYSVDTFNGNTPLNVRIGYSNWAQVEYRIYSDNTMFSDYEYWDETQTEIDMKRKLNEMFFKFNLLSLFNEIPKKIPAGLFIVYGIGNSSGFIDNYGDGFKDGDVTSYGIELFGISKLFNNRFLCYMWSFGAEYETTTYHEFEMEGYQTLKKDFTYGFFRMSINLSIGFSL